MGVLYNNGEGVPKDCIRALMWYRMAFADGSPKAAHNLGRMYEDDCAVHSNYETALRYYRVAAEKGIAQSQMAVGDYFYHGDVVHLDYTKAREYYLKAAVQGFAPAEERLGYIYAFGLGVREDHVTAYSWLTIAYANAKPYEKPSIDYHLYRLLLRTPADQVAEAQRLAVRCRLTRYRDCTAP